MTLLPLCPEQANQSNPIHQEVVLQALQFLLWLARYGASGIGLSRICKPQDATV